MSGHDGVAGNERADLEAKDAAAGSSSTDWELPPLLHPPAVQHHGRQAAFQDIIDAGLEKPLERVSPLSVYS